MDIGYDPEGRNPGKKPIVWMLIDSAIIAGIAMMAVLPEHIPTATEVWIAVKTFIYAFLVQLAIERGLKKWIRRRR